MARVWYCRNCGYEVHSRGRCHACREKLVASALPELEPGAEEDEVGYRIDGWSEPDRVRLIVRLNDLGLAHRFEEEELVVDAADEARVDDLMAVLDVGAVGDEADDVDEASDGEGGETHHEVVFDELDDDVAPDDEDLRQSVQLLADAAARLHHDPTDMQADADVAEASTAVFTVGRFGALDEATWSAVGRVTRSLLSLLGAEEAMEDGIRTEAAVLEKLLAPISRGPAPPAGASTPRAAGEADDPAAAGAVVRDEQTVYELPEWLPEQRAELGVLLEEAGIAYEWEGDELVVPAAREEDVEALFEQVAGTADEEDEETAEARYRAVAELFAACGRLASDPADEVRQELVVEWAEQAEGPPLLGMDEIDWFRIMTRTRSLLAALEAADDIDLIRQEAGTLHDLLRSVV